ncbi:MAG: hypothetical protein WBD31_20615 [Rubripirellula sp.]
MNLANPSFRIETLSVLACLLMVGCDDPINRPSQWTPPPADWTLVATDDPSKYQWPLTKQGYRVDRPPQMGYVTSFDGRIPCPDPVTSEVVPWKTDGEDKTLVAILKNAYKPPEPRLKPVLQLNPGQFAGVQAFDVAEDGTRMIAIDDQGIAMYKTEDGELIGHMKLPSEFSGAAPAQAVRFCGSSKDMMIASPSTIVRISSTNGSVIGQCPGIGEPIADWFVNTNDDTTLVRGESGKLFGGDSRLSNFKPYNLGSRVTASAAALNDTGDRIAVTVDNHPRIYLLKDQQIIDQIDSDQVTLDPNSDVAFIGTTEAWVDGDGVFCNYVNDHQTTDTNLYHMFWKPHLISPVHQDEGHRSSLMVGTRLIDNQSQPVLFGFTLSKRAHTVPIILDDIPTRISHSRDGKYVALLTDGVLAISHRDSWHHYGFGSFQSWSYDLMKNGKFDVVEKLLTAISKQNRLGYGGSPATLRSELYEGLKYRVVDIRNDASDGDEIKNFDALVKSGNQTALVVNAMAHYSQGWKDRGSGMGSTVSQSGWESYGDHLKKAKESLEKVMDMSDRPPLKAIECMVKVVLETEGSLDDVDPLARLASQLYPGELSPHTNIMFKLMPQWFGEPGDAASFAVSASKMFEEPYSDLLYMRMAARSAEWFNSRNQESFKTFDPVRAERGLDECIRQNAAIESDLWKLWLDLFLRSVHRKLMNRTFARLMETTAAIPPNFGGSQLRGIENNIHAIAELMRKGDTKALQ